MQCNKVATLLTAALAAGVTGSSLAQGSSDELQEMRSELSQMRAEMSQLRAQQQGDWLNDARREELKGLINDVMADAQARGSFLDEGALAGIDDKGKVFIKSADGSFTMNINGQIQARYIWNNIDNRADESLSGIQMRRVKLGVKGSVGDGWGYSLKIETNRSGGNNSMEEAFITYDFNDEWSMLVGVDKLPFARQELISSSKQVAVDRTLVTEFFTLNRSDMVMFEYEKDALMARFALSDGGNASWTEYNADASNDFALTARVDYMVMGDSFKAAGDEFGGVENDALYVGGAAHYQVADKSANPESGLAWTLDALYKTGGLGLTAAIFGNHTDSSTASDTDQFGVYVQGDYKLTKTWDVFARWEHINDDTAGTEDLQAITFGVNNHITKNAKFTGDVVYIYAGDNPVAAGNFINGGELSSGLGLTGTGFSDAEDQIALRLQLQLLF